ncbi:MAG: FecR domain-containing protein [Elusimicrobia bacterium]|nr:FecR domain-containing protein [Elusimicrobiota bacterium]
MGTKRRWTAAAVSALIAAGSLSASTQDQPEDADREARLTSVEGTVYLHLHDHQEGEFIPAEADATIEDGDMIRTGEDGTAEFTLDGESVISISPNSDFIVNSLAPEHTEFHVGIGSILAKIKHLLDGQSMEFHTPTAVAAVRGTELAVSQEGDDQPARVGVFDEGQVAVTAVGGKESAQLGPGQELEVHKDKALGQPATLRHFAGSRRRFEFVRHRAGEVSKNWTRRDAKLRREWRQRLRSKQTVRGGHLKGVRRQMQGRKYGHLRARQNLLRRGRQKRLQNQEGGPAPKRRQHLRPPQEQGESEGRQQRQQEKAKRREEFGRERQRQREEQQGQRRQQQQQRQQPRDERRQRRR